MRQQFHPQALEFVERLRPARFKANIPYPVNEFPVTVSFIKLFFKISEHKARALRREILRLLERVGDYTTKDGARSYPLYRITPAFTVENPLRSEEHKSALHSLRQL